MSERANCAVRAVTAVTSFSYQRIHSEFRLAGRIRSRRTPNHMTEQVLLKLGYSIQPWRVNGRTVLTVERELPSTGAFLIHIRSHVLAFVDGSTDDHTSGSRRRVKSVHRITR